MRILVIEDHRETAAHLLRRLGDEGYQVDHAADGAAGLLLASRHRYDMLLVDRMLPKLAGLDLIMQLRSAGNPVPAIVLSALDKVDDRIAGLRAGADDYLVKPCSMPELLARIDAILRRSSATACKTVLCVDTLELNLLERTARRGARRIDLQDREFRLIEYLLRNAGNVVTRRMVFEHVWEYLFDPQTNIIDVHISRLRAKVDQHDDTPLIHTVRGIGYRLGAARKQ